MPITDRSVDGEVEDIGPKFQNNVNELQSLGVPLEEAKEFAADIPSTMSAKAWLIKRHIFLSKFGIDSTVYPGMTEKD